MFQKARWASASVIFTFLSLCGATTALGVPAGLASLHHPVPGAYPVVHMEEPMNLESKHVYDPADVLGNGIHQVEASIQAAQNHDMSVYVAIVNSFSGYEPAEWSSRVVKLSGIQANSYLLSLAIEDKSYYAASTTGSVVNTTQTGNLATQVVAPQIANGDYAAAVSSFVQQLVQLSTANANNVSADQSLETTHSTSRWLIIILLAAMVAAVALAVALYRRTSAPASTDESDYDAALADNEAADFTDESQEQFTYASPDAQEIQSDVPGLYPETSPNANYAAGEYLPAGNPVFSDQDAAEPASFTQETAQVPQETALPETNEADYHRTAKAVQDLGCAILSAEEDLDAAEKALGASATSELGEALSSAHEQYLMLLDSLENSEGISSDDATEIVQAARNIKEVLSVQVISYAKKRHDPQKVKESLQYLAQLWNQSRKEFTQAEAVATEMFTVYANAHLEHTKANIHQAKSLLQASYKGIIAAQKLLKSAEISQSIKYLRACERAIIQTTQVSNSVFTMHNALVSVPTALASLQAQLRETLHGITAGGQTGPEVARAERALDMAEEVLHGSGNPINALTQLYGIQSSLYQAHGIVPDSAVIESDLQTRLNLVSSLLNVERLHLRLRRKFVDVELQASLNNCEKLISLAQQKSAAEAETALRVLNSCAEVLVQIDAQMPVDFPHSK